MIQLTNLLRIVQQLPPGSSLPEQVSASSTSLQTADVRATCASLRATGNEVRAQSGKKLTSLPAEYLGSATARVRSALGC